MGSSHELHLHGTKKYGNTITQQTGSESIFSGVPAAEDSIAHASIWLRILSKTISHFFERSHSDESIWSNNEQRWSSVRCLALYGANRLVIVVLYLGATPTMLLLLPASTLLCRNKPQLLARPLHKETALPLRSTLTTLEENCANVDSNNGYCFGILTSIYFTTRCSL